MIKKRILTIFFLILTIMVLFFWVDYKTSYFAGEFSVQKYQWAIEKYPSDQTVGAINNAKEAKEKAVLLWRKEFNTAPDGSPQDPMENIEQIHAWFDAENDCWLVRGDLPDNMVGWVPALIVKSNGDVLALFHW